MTRLFVSLYLAVTLALLAIGWGADYIWQQTQDANDEDIFQLAQLAQLAANNSYDEASVEQLANQLGLGAKLLPSNQIAFMPEQQLKLMQGKALINYDEQDNLYVLVQSGAHALQFGPITTSDKQLASKTLAQLISYLLLALAILFWSWPLWRDLIKLQALSRAYAKGNFKHQNPISETSVIAPIGRSFEFMARQIAEMIDQQKQMFNAVSHDIRTPLARLKFSTAMVKSELPETAAEMNHDIKEMENLVEEILRFARLDAETQLEFTQVNLAELLTHQNQKLSRNSEKKLLLTQSGNLSLVCDGNLIERACQNLIVNAFRHAKSQVCVTAEKVAGELHISVEDDGDGIDESDINKIFKPFSRLESSRNKASGGYGLGLAIVKKIVDWHCGRCEVSKSKLGGAQFTIILPTKK